MPHSHDTPIPWTADEEKILMTNYGELTYEQIAAMLPNRTWMAVRHHASLLGLTGTSNLGRKYSVNKEFFAIPNILNSYWAGFIAADGNIYNNRLKVNLSVRDILHLERLRDALHYTGKVRCYGNKSVLNIKCPSMAEDLKKNFNITPRKSLTLEPPPLTDENMIRAFITGVIDGDGCIRCVEIDNRRYLHIFVCGTQLMMEWIKGYVDCWSPPGSYRTAKVHKRPNCNFYCYAISAKRAAKVGYELLKVDVPRLDRKWSKVEKFFANSRMNEEKY